MSSCQRRSRSQASSPRASARLVEPTMSVNMNVLRAVCGPAPAVRDVAQLALGGLDVDPRAEPPELVERGLELEVGVVVVVDRAEGPRQDRPGAGDLVRRADLAPALDRRPQLPDRAGRVALGEEDAAEGDLAAGLERRRRVAADDRRRARRRPSGPGRRRRPRSRSRPGPAGAGRGPSDPRSPRATAASMAVAAALTLPSASRISASAGCGVRPRACASRSAASAPCEVAAQPPDVADRVEAVGLRRRGVVGRRARSSPVRAPARPAPRRR